VHLELGGKAPMVVLDDADPAAVAEALKIAGYYNSGQDCTAAARILAAPGIHDELLEAIVPAVESLSVGDPAEADDLDMGQVVSTEQQQRVLGFVERARAGGAQVLTGGGTLRDRGAFVAPTVLTGVGQRDEIVQEEVFGPVVTVQRFESDEQAIAWANDVPYGLAASVCTRDVARALNASRLLEFGCVWINDHLPFASEMPQRVDRHMGNRFHYYRQTDDHRILWGGFDAIYDFRGRVEPERDQRPETFELGRGDRHLQPGAGPPAPAPVPARAGPLGRDPAHAASARPCGRALRAARAVAAHARPAGPRVRLVSG
jgi:betaine-aldehyde dehydrogenase/aminobutyraldehyde dehydrogenase